MEKNSQDKHNHKELYNDAVGSPAASSTEEEQTTQHEQDSSCPPSCTPDEEKQDDGQKKTSAKTTENKHRPSNSQKQSRRIHRPWWQIVVLVLFVICAVGAALYANGNIPGTPRAQKMSECKTETANAQESLRLASLAIKDAKEYRDNLQNTIEEDDLRNMTVLIDDAEKEPDIPSCSFSMSNADLDSHITTAKQLNDVYVTITKELLQITGKSDTDDSNTSNDEASSSMQQSPVTPRYKLQPSFSPSESTDVASPSASPTTSQKSSASATPTPTQSPQSSASASPSATSRPSQSPSPSSSSTATQGS